ncbi:thymidine kinase [Arthrobacter sp. NamB2]|uniref:thymidine kinase n=1 Tax=unclassified Arthrobacter TaxID=235627 RepID=UPI000CE3BD12|nr:MULTISPECIES: thymidine kinase [unclassified Arthrobacter]TKV28183.1 thymidine kinase [Arthrobacter sp. NamB2]
MAELLFFSGTMDCGKSTLALQMDHNHKARGRRGILFSSHDRAGESMISSRLGLQVPAVEVFPGTDFWAELTLRQTMGARIDYVICDEAQFYTTVQIDQLARVVDEMDIDVFTFGITSDFRTRLFPGSQRLIELADRVQVLQVEALCWCGKRATHNARTVDGVMVVEGDQMVVGDVDQPIDQDSFAAATDAVRTAGRESVVGYETLCRRHHMRRQTSRTSPSLYSNEEPLPFDPRQLDPRERESGRI